VIGVVVVASILIRQRVPKKYHQYFPNFVALGVPFTLPHPVYGFPLLCGALAAFFLKKYRPALWEMYGYPTAAGLAAGEACSGLLSAGLVLAGVGAEAKGSTIGLPWQT